MALKLCSIQDVKDRTKGGDKFESTFDALLGKIIDAVTLQLARHFGRPDWDKLARTEYFNPGVYAKRIFLASPPVASTPAIQVWESTAAPRVYGADELLVLDTDYFSFSETGIVAKDGYALWAEGLKSVKIVYTGGYLESAWAAAPGTPTYVSAGTFTVTGDYTTVYYPGRALRYKDTAGGSVFQETTVLASSLSAGVTTVTVADSGLDSGLNTVEISTISGAPADLAEAAIRQAKLVFDRREAGGLGSQSLEGGSFSFSSGLKLDPSVLELLGDYRVRPGPT